MTDTKPVQDRNLGKDLPFYVPLTGPKPVALGALRCTRKTTCSGPYVG